MPTIFSKGIKYLKISKIDANGNLQTSHLEEIDKIRIKYTDSGIAEYNIIDRAEYSTYYLLSTILTEKTSSSDNEILDYYTSASVDFSVIPDITESYGPPQFSFDPPNAIIAGNSLGYLGDGTGYFTLENTPNVRLIITASATISASGVSTGGGRFKLISTLDGVDSIIAYTTLDFPTFTSGTLYITSSYNPLNTEKISLGIDRLFGNLTQSLTQISLLITQSQDTQSSVNDLVIMEPYFNNSFAGSDCDVLYGDISLLENNQYYFDVDYSNGINNPVNFGAIMSGTAVPATVNNYNYSLRRSIYPRYYGSTLYQLNPDKWTEGDVGYGKTPSVRTEIPFFAYFDFGANVRPEIMGKSHYHIKYLIDEDGNVYNPDLNSYYFWNLTKGLEAGKNTKLILRGSNYNTALINSKIYKIHRSGKRVQPIIYSQLKYENVNNVLNTDYTGAIWFENSINSISDADDFSFLTSTTSSIPISGFSTTTNSFNSIITDDAGYWSLATHTYTFTTAPSSPFDLALQMIVGGSSGVISTNAKILKNDVVIAVLGNAVGSPSPITANGTYTDFFENIAVEPGDTLKVQIVENGPGSFNAKTALQLFPQTLLSQSIDVPYWKTGSLSKNVLTGSGQMTGSLYGNPYMKQTDISGSGFDNIVNYLQILPGDEIRFEGNERKAYTIGLVENPSDDGTFGKLYLYLNKPIFNPTNLDNFVIRRYTDDPGYVIINFNKDPYLDMGDGFLLPEYPTQKLIDNFDNIINKMFSDGLITEG